MEEIEELLKKLKIYGWHKLYFDTDAGFLVLIGVIGPEDYEPDDIYDADYGIIYISRDYKMGEWDKNYWSASFHKIAGGLSTEEVQLINCIMSYLQEYKEFPKNGDQCINELYENRLFVELLIEKWEEM